GPWRPVRSGVLISKVLDPAVLVPQRAPRVQAPGVERPNPEMAAGNPGPGAVADRGVQGKEDRAFAEPVGHREGTRVRPDRGLPAVVASVRRRADTAKQLRDRRPRDVVR